MTMALPASCIPKSVAHLNVEVAAAALIRHDANVRNHGARARRSILWILRKLVLIDQRLADAALEAIELRLDAAEANLSEALHCGDPRRRDVVSRCSYSATRSARRREGMRSRPRRRSPRGQPGQRPGVGANRRLQVGRRRFGSVRWMSSSATGRGLSISWRYGGESWATASEGALAGVRAVLIEHADHARLEPAPGLEVEPAEEPSAIEASEPRGPCFGPAPGETAAVRYAGHTGSVGAAHMSRPFASERFSPRAPAPAAPRLFAPTSTQCDKRDGTALCLAVRRLLPILPRDYRLTTER